MYLPSNIKINHSNDSVICSEDKPVVTRVAMLLIELPISKYLCNLLDLHVNSNLKNQMWSEVSVVSFPVSVFIIYGYNLWCGRKVYSQSC